MLPWQCLIAIHKQNTFTGLHASKIRYYFLVKLTTPDAGEQYTCILIDLRNDYLSLVFSLGVPVPAAYSS